MTGPNDRSMLTGVEALARLLVVRHEVDRAAGLETATMISGYPGSPLGGLDLVLEQFSTLLNEHRVLHRPGVNEELALAIAWGSQMGAALPYHEVHGVVGAWYGKTPGLDRSGDVLRHANAMGSGPNGGLVLFCGDDPSAKSSTLNCDSQYTFQDACVPLLYPGDQQEILEFGMHAFAMSRLAGPLVGLKIITAVADGAGTVILDPAHYQFEQPQTLHNGSHAFHHEPLGKIGPHQVPDQESLVTEQRLAAAQAYVRAMDLDRVVGALDQVQLGIIAAGKTYFDVIQALTDLGLSLTDLADRGIAVLKLAMTYPIVPETVRELADRAQLLLVVEEKRPFIETQLRAILHEADYRVPVVGKRDRNSQPLLPAVGELDPGQVAQAIARLLPELKPEPSPSGARLLPLQMQVSPPPRPPEYCSGCPHNRSTLVPQGALTGGGVGCHGIMYFEPRQREVPKLPPPPMGAEGVPWIGLAPFVSESHLFQNLGDGTFSHSGLLAIRASVAAKVNVTFKILYNAAVAMTGGQPVAGLLDIPALTRELEAEGVVQTIVCSEDPARYGRKAHFANGVEVLGRDDLAEAQQRLRGVQGVTVLIYDQRCASEARRLRRRGLLPTPAARVLINEAVCEGCGDCRTKSNCASVLPHPTEFGEKRRIDDLTCNRDYTCLQGDCPSFVTLVPKPFATQRAAQGAIARPTLPVGTLPTPPTARIPRHFGVYFTGIGGTGVVTAGRILTAAAEAAGLAVSSMDQTGLAQRGGAVVSHLHFAQERSLLGAPTVGPQGADLYLSGDIFQAATGNHLNKVRPGHTVAAISRTVTPTASMQQTGQAAPALATLEQAITERTGAGKVAFIDSHVIAEQVFAQPVLGNVVLLGAAFQLGGLPLTLADIEAGMKQRGVPASNREAFEWGRWAVHAPETVRTALDSSPLQPGHPSSTPSPFEPTPASSARAQTLLAQRPLPEELAELVTRRLAQVIDYQSAKLGQRFLALIERALTHDTAANQWALTRAITEGWFKLLTYKDEYEVARLHTRTSYDGLAKALGIAGPYTLKYHLHPPILRRFGLKHKLPLGKLYDWTFRLLRRLKFLRGTPFDPFGHDADRRLERALIHEYQALVVDALEARQLPYSTQVELASSALSIRGYGEVKERAVVAWRKRVADLTASNRQHGEAAE